MARGELTRYHRGWCVLCGRPFVSQIRPAPGGRLYCDHPLCTSARMRERKRKSLARLAVMG